MGEFMQQQGDEEQDCSDQRSDPDLAGAPIRGYLTEVLAEGERDQGSDDEPAVVKPNLYSGDFSEFDVGTHRQFSLETPHTCDGSAARARHLRLCCSLNDMVNTNGAAPYLQGNHDPGDTAHEHNYSNQRTDRPDRTGGPLCENQYAQQQAGHGVG